MSNNLHDFIPDLAGKVAIVTGGHTGLGFGTSIELAKHGARVYIASRSAAKFKDAEQDILSEYPKADVRFLMLDLADLNTVREATERFAQQESSLHLLVNNAGVMCIPYEETGNGFEMQIGVNYIGHFVFTKLLIPILQKTAETTEKGSVRVVNVSSDGHAKLAPKEGIIFSDMNMKNDFSVWARYGHSKLANVLHSRALAKRYPNILTLSLHPGTVKTYVAVSCPTIFKHGSDGAQELIRRADLVNSAVSVDKAACRAGCAWSTKGGGKHSFRCCVTEATLGVRQWSISATNWKGVVAQ
ncbi:Glucose/ribitol dehydrogenase [Penicillium expansum]|nr:Glucose/ribitol dehydrogenase [Penicillium expansum]